MKMNTKIEKLKVKNSAALIIFIIFISLLITGCSAKVKAADQDNGIQNRDISGNINQQIRDIKIEAYSGGFEPSTIIVKKGETVRIIGTSRDLTHGLAISQFNVNMQLEKGKYSSAEFKADKEGTFVFYCSIYCGEGHKSQRGTLIVE